MKEVKKALSLIGEEYTENNNCITIKSYFNTMKIKKDNHGNILILTNLGLHLFSSFFLLFSGLILFDNNIYISAWLASMGLISLTVAVISESKANVLRIFLLHESLGKEKNESL